MKEERYYKVLACSFIIILVVIFSMKIILKDREFSESENRMLTQKPKFSIDRVLEGRYTKKYEKYVSDQIYGRDLWVMLKSKVDSLLNVKESNGVYKCEDNYYMEAFNPLPMDDINKNIEAINDFAKKHSEIETYFFNIPAAISILDDKLPNNAPIIDQKSYIDNFEDSLHDNITFIDCYDTLKEHKDEYIYYKTDHHWTSLGAYYAFLEFANHKNMDIVEYEEKIITNAFEGTLTSIGGYNPKELDEIKIYIPKSDDEFVVNYVEEQEKSTSLYCSDYLGLKDKYSVFLGGNHPLVRINTTVNNNERLLIIKDSYANEFVQFLTPYYRDIVMVDPRYYYDDINKLIKDEKITEIMYMYNANGFFNDNSLNLVLQEEA